MTRKPNIFIASSSPAKALAEYLKLTFQKAPSSFDEVWAWSEDLESGTTITEALKDWAANADFALVILTGDDRRTKAGESQPLNVPRDNCIFEAGLFTGALGIDHKRCFLASSVDLKALPTDLLGPKFIKFEMPEDVEDDKQCLKKMQPVVAEILLSVRKLGCYRRPLVPLLTSNELLGLERVGANIQAGSEIVLVYATEPLEKDYQFAQRVMENMKKRVCYEYYFHGNQERIYGVWDMIQMLSLAGLVPDAVKIPPGEAEAFETLQRIEENPEDRKKVLDNLRTISLRLRVYFLPRVAGIEFCVHNASNKDFAKGYLRYDTYRGQFIEWYEGPGGRAINIAQDVRNRCVNDSQGLIFCSTQGFLLNDQKDFRKGLNQAINSYFPEGEFKQKVEEICFGNPVAKTA